jgi:hypothetical protein
VLTNSQIDKLGAKLRGGEVDANCLRDLEDFQALYVPAYRHVERVLVETMGLKISGRPSKSTVALTEKLKRESFRLNQIQDISGCRVIVPNLAIQDHIVGSMQVLLENPKIATRLPKTVSLPDLLPHI